MRCQSFRPEWLPIGGHISDLIENFFVGGLSPAIFGKNVVDEKENGCDVFQRRTC